MQNSLEVAMTSPRRHFAWEENQGRKHCSHCFPIFQKWHNLPFSLSFLALADFCFRTGSQCFRLEKALASVGCSRSRRSWFVYCRGCQTCPVLVGQATSELFGMQNTACAQNNENVSSSKINWENDLEKQEDKETGICEFTRQPSKKLCILRSG